MKASRCDETERCSHQRCHHVHPEFSCLGTYTSLRGKDLYSGQEIWRPCRLYMQCDKVRTTGRKSLCQSTCDIRKSLHKGVPRVQKGRCQGKNSHRFRTCDVESPHIMMGQIYPRLIKIVHCRHCRPCPKFPQDHIAGQVSSLLGQEGT